MVDITAISAVFSSLKMAKDITEAMVDLRDAAAFQTKLIELQRTIMDAQGAVFSVNDERTTLSERVRELEKQVAQLEAWEAEKQKYELVDLHAACGRPMGAFAYARKEGMQPSEPMHKICAACYQNGQKSILQYESRSPGRNEVLFCQRCGADVYVTGHWSPEHSRRTNKGNRN